MIRDYTDKTKKRLLKQIDEVNSETWCWLTDEIGDCLSTASKWLGILNLKDDMSNVESYQKEILDKTDMTKKELKKIFEKVYLVDNKFKNNFFEVNEKESTYNEKLEKLIGMINPNFQIASSKEILAAVTKYNDKLKNIDQKIAETYTAEMDWAAKETLKDAGNNFLKGLGKMASGIGSIMSGNPTGAIDVINGFFRVGSSLETALNLGGYASYGGIADLRGESLSEKLSQKNSFLNESEKSADNEGLADALRDKGFDSVATAMDVIDTGIAICNFAEGFNNFINGSGPKIFDGNIGFKLNDASDDYFKLLSKSWKNIGKSINYVALFFDASAEGSMDDFYKTITKSAIPAFNQLQSAADTVKDGVDLFVDAVQDLFE